jgi:peptide/nickel transport system substrate-binding protein
LADEDSLEFRVLGPFEVSEGGRPLDVGSGKQRALLALLLLRAGQVVSTDGLIDALWGERPPPSAPNSVHIYVSRLRRALGNGRLETRGHGYLLRLGPQELDLGRFERLLVEGRELLAGGDATRAAETLRAALSLWRGPPLSDFASEPFAQIEIARLEELHQAALEERIEADLALGRHAELVPELEALVREHPLRERLRAQLMLALYRSGRQADALAAYRQARRTLGEELGLEPGRALQELERAILRQDADLDPPERASRVAVRAPRRSGALIAIGASVLLAAVVAFASIELARDDGPGLAAASPNVVAAIDTSSNRLVADVPLGNGPTSVAAGEGSVWVTNAYDGTVSRIDPVTRSVRQTIEVGDSPSGIAVGAGAVWVANHADSTVSRIDPATNAVVQTVDVGNGPLAVAFGEGSVWVTNSLDRSVSRVDPARGREVSTIETDAVGRGIAVGGGSVWITDESSNRVARIDPATNTVAETIGVGNGPSGIAFGEQALWVANAIDGTVSRIDPASGTVTAAIAVPGGPGAVAVAGGDVWVSVEFGERLLRINPVEAAVVEDVAIGNRPKGVVVTNDRVWVAVQASGRGHRGGRLIVVSVELDSIDPAIADLAESRKYLMGVVYDGLTGFRRVGGSEGTQLVPNLAVSIPTARDEGRMYTFRLRPGLRYADGRVVRPEDFRRGLERAFELGGYLAEQAALTAVAGAGSCSRGRRCDLSEGVIARRDSVTFRLSRPAPLFLFALTELYPAPRGTPRSAIKTNPVPGTGPYTIDSYVPGRQLRLVRNPHFRVWSDAAQPDGFADEVVFRLGLDDRKNLAAVSQGRADVFSFVPPDRVSELKARYAPQVHEVPERATTFLFMNIERPPFDDVRVRRALNYAIDRRRVVELHGEAQATCQVIPPTVPGYVRHCPYTLDPRRSGEWTAPNLEKAQHLIAASHTKGQRVIVWTFPYFAKESRYVVSLLRRLGYRAQLKEVQDIGRYFATISDPKIGAHSGLAGWFGLTFGFDALDTLRCGFDANWARFCDRTIDRQVQQSLDLLATDPHAAARTWSTLDRQLVNEAPWVPLFTPRLAFFVSKRVGNWQYHLYDYVLFDQLWVR